ncbi:MAG: NUDIX domain-containing protein [Candidatus Woesearchaeota archaeon]
MTKPPLSIVLATLVHDNKILLIKRIKGHYIGLWSLPGGKIENHEHVSDAAIREVKEEAGIESEFIEHLGNVSEHLLENGDVDQHFLIHLCKLHPKTTVICNHDKNSKYYEGKLEWFDLDKLHENKHLIILSDYLMIQHMFLNFRNNKNSNNNNNNNNNIKRKNYYECVIEKIKDEYILRKFE